MLIKCIFILLGLIIYCLFVIFIQDFLLKKTAKKSFIFFIKLFRDYKFFIKFISFFNKKAFRQRAFKVSTIYIVFEFIIVLLSFFSLDIFDDIFKKDISLLDTNILMFLILILSSLKFKFDVRFFIAFINVSTLGLLSFFLIGLSVNSFDLVEIVKYQNTGISNWLIFKNPISFLLFLVVIFIRENQISLNLSDIFKVKNNILKIYILLEYLFILSSSIFISDIYFGGLNSIWFIDKVVAMFLKVFFIVFISLILKFISRYIKRYKFIKKSLIYGTILGYIGILISVV